MKISLRTLAVGSFATALTALGLSAYPSIAGSFDPVEWDVDALSQELRDQEQLSREMDHQSDLALYRINLRHQILDDLCSARTTPDEAAAKFAEITRQYPGAEANVRLLYHGRTEEERAGKQLLAYLRTCRKPGADAMADEWECVLDSRR